MTPERRGRLKIFLGYAAGVGKTYSMLEGARQKKNEGVDVVIGLAVTHGRKETERLLEGLEIVPTAKIPYKGVELAELDVDGVLKRKPELAIVDELAHTNVPGSRHIKRYMDVEELLEAGIDVYTTLNIQHLESFQDPIEQATGVAVRERVPDRILDEANEVELVDLAPEELLERLRQGKVYVPEQAARAIHKFFRKENLQLLREIALRKTAAIVDTGRGRVPGEAVVAQVAPKLLASIGPSPFSERVIRVTKRLADMLKAEWWVASVETPDMAFRPAEQRRQVAQHLRLAEELGAKVVTLPGEYIADTIFNYAKAQGVTQIIVGHSLMPWFQRLWKRSPVDELVRKDAAIDVYVISSGFGSSEIVDNLPETHNRRWSPKKWFTSLGISLSLATFLTLVLTLASDTLSPTSQAVICLLATALSALFLTPFSFYLFIIFALFMLDAAYVTDIDQWVTKGEPMLFAVATLIIGVTVNRLTTRRKRLVAAAVARHQEMLRLFELSRDLASASGPEAMLVRVNQHLGVLAHAEAVLYLKDKGEYKRIGTVDIPFDATEQMAARWALDHREAAGMGTHTLPSARGIWLPLYVAERPVLGALGVYPIGESSWQEDRGILEAFAHLMALSLDRSEAESKSEEEG
jgi:two-component system sensor histidine kinase KdpD